MSNNLFGVDIDKMLLELWDEKIIKENGVTDLDGAEYSEHITMLQRNAQKIKLALSNVVIRTNQYLLDHMSSKTDLNAVIQALNNYVKRENIASSVNESDITKLVTVSILRLLKDELKTDYQSQINVLKDVLKVSDSTLDELREIVSYIKLNREILSNLHITKMAGYVELDTRINAIDTLAKDNQTKLESLDYYSSNDIFNAIDGVSRAGVTATILKNQVTLTIQGVGKTLNNNLSIKTLPEKFRPKSRYSDGIGYLRAIEVNVDGTFKIYGMPTTFDNQYVTVVTTYKI